jgi:hypothetical protein
MVLATRQSWRMMVLLILVLAFACSGATCVRPMQGTLALREAQDVFNEAALLTNQRYAEPFTANEKSTDVVPPESAQDKYARVVQLVNEEVLNSLDRDDLKINAWALLAFSEWQLKHYGKANIAAETGKDLYERSGLQTNRRDYGMLIILRGLVKHSQAYDSYQAERAKGNLDMATAERLSQAMAAGLDDIDEINAKLGKDEPVVIYANRQQLLIIDNIMRVWADAQQADKPQQEMVRKQRCEWAAKGLKLWKDRFPENYALKKEVDQLGGNLQEVSKILRCV